MTEFQAQTNLELCLSKFPFNSVWMFHFFHQCELIKLLRKIQANQDLYPGANVSDASSSLYVLNLATTWPLSCNGIRNVGLEIHVFLSARLWKEKNSA